MSIVCAIRWRSVALLPRCWSGSRRPASGCSGGGDGDWVEDGVMGSSASRLKSLKKSFAGSMPERRVGNSVVKICLIAGTKAAGSEPPKSIFCSAALREISSLVWGCCWAWVCEVEEVNPAVMYASLTEAEIDVRKISNARKWITELEVRVAMLVYAARRVFEVSGAGIGIEAPAWLCAAVDIALRAV